MRNIVSFTLAAFCSLPTLGADWPQFRGPLGNGVSAEKNLPIQWSENKNIAWGQEIAGKAWSSPALVKGRLYLTTALQADGKLSQRAICLNAKDGKQVWDTEIF